MRSDKEQKYRIGGAKRGLGLFFLMAWLLAAPGCSEPTPTTNPVQSIEMAAFTAMISAEDFTGIVVVMASWCPPCREELPELVKLHKQYNERGLRIVAVSIDDGGPAAVQPLVNSLKIPFPVYWGGRNAASTFRIVGIPTALLVKKGMITAKLTGQQSRRAFEKHIEGLLKQ